VTARVTAQPVERECVRIDAARLRCDELFLRGFRHAGRLALDDAEESVAGDGWKR
jgi:hypothetical protein